MKTLKISLIAAMLIGSSANALDNTKVSGAAELYYGTQGLFSKDKSYADLGAHLDLTTDLSKGIYAGVGMQVVTTLGLKNNLANVWSNAHNEQVDSAMWIDEAWLATTAYDTTFKIGRQTLDTPLVFTESWGVDKNTFEAAVLINQSLPDTTIIAAYVVNSNGSADDRNGLREGGTGNLNDMGVSKAGYVAQDGLFSTFGTNGAYALGAVNNSIEDLTVQAWYYHMTNFADAYWLQADLKNGKGGFIGVQYANVALLSNAHLGTLAGPGKHGSDVTTKAYSVLYGYEMKDIGTIKVAHSSVSKNGLVGVANTATGSLATIGGKSKLYTEMQWNYGKVSAPGAQSISITAESTVHEDIDLLVGYYNCDIETGRTTGYQDENAQELALIASTTFFGVLDTKLAVIFADVEDKKTTDIQMYLTYNF